MIEIHKGINNNRRKVLIVNRGLRNRKTTRMASKTKSGMITSHAIIEWGNRKGSDANSIPTRMTTARDE
jgi:hypothetical protein